MAETFLWMMTQKSIFGIPLIRLMELGEEEAVDLESIYSPPFDFHLKLPERYMRPFVFDSKLFLACGDTYSEPDDDALSYKFYQLFFEDVDDNNIPRISEAAADSIPPPPTAVSRSFIANIAGEVYLLVYDGDGDWTSIPRDEGLWVLRSGEWQLLQDPPILDDDGFSGCIDCFVHQDKLFLKAHKHSAKYLYAFDPRTHTWTIVEGNIKISFALWDCDGFHFPSIPVSLPDVCNCRVTLSWKPDKICSLKIYAMLVNNLDDSVYCYQSLDECSIAIKPSCFSFSGIQFLDLGDGRVCAVVNGHVPERSRSPLICVLVFALSLLQELDTEAPGKEKRFLNVDRVLVNRVFSMEDYSSEELQHALIFPPIEELHPEKCLATTKE